MGYKIRGVLTALTLVAGMATAQETKPIQPLKVNPRTGPTIDMDAVKAAEGKPLPDFKMTLLDDKVLTNKDLKGKVAVIDFWATWCGPCKAAAPKLDALYKEFKDKGLVIVGANLAEKGSDGKPLQTKDNAVAYVKQHGYGYPFTYGNDALGKEWKVPGYPTFFIVDREGTVREVMVGFREGRMRQLVTELVTGENAPTTTSASAPAPTEEPTAEEMIAAIRKGKTAKEQSEAILKFALAYPNHDQTPQLLAQRWIYLIPKYPPTPEDLKAGIADTEDIAKRISNPKVVAAAKFQGTLWRMALVDKDPAAMRKIADEFRKEHPTDPKNVSLLTTIARSEPDRDKKIKVYEEIIKDFGTSPSAAYIPGKIKQLKGVGQPFELSFTDAITGKPVNMADYKGKVVVIDFWATWCGPCIADLPKIKDLYARYKEKGVEIISISLDQPVEKGGLDKLKDFVAKNDMPWAHYYQGNYWASDFSKSWGINAIPSLFLIDQKGNLIDVEARQNLEDRIKKLLGS